MFQGQDLGGLWKQSSPWQATTTSSGQTPGCNLACSLPRFPLAMLDHKVGQPVPSTESNELPTPRAQAPSSSTHVLGRVTGAEQNRFQKNKQPGVVVNNYNPSSGGREACCV